jgi:general stress protein YciG
MSSELPKEVLKFFQKTGAQGGRMRAKTHSKEQLSEWGKKGGRPKGSGKKRAKKGGK